MDSNLLATKSIEKLVGDVEHGTKALRRSLTAFDLTLLGIGAIIGTGIFVLTGTAAANQAGPAIVLSYIAAGLACALLAFTGSIPQSENVRRSLQYPGLAVLPLMLLARHYFKTFGSGANQRA